MTTVQVVLPDELAAEAQEAGLLSDARVETWLREELQRRKGVGLLEILDTLGASADEIGLTPEEVAEEIHLMRAERRRPAA